MLLEIHARTGFVNAFAHVSEAEARAGDPATSICAVLAAEAGNTGLEPFVRADVPALRRHRLSWVRQNYIRAETLTKANARLVAAQNDIELARCWGGGDVASADGLRFVVPVRTIHAGPNPKYYGMERGVTYYNMMSDQSTGLNGIVVPGTLRDSLQLLSVVLEQETDFDPTKIMTDTGAYSDVIFAVFWLLGCQFSPRLADVAGTNFWRPFLTSPPETFWFFLPFFVLLYWQPVMFESRLLTPLLLGVVVGIGLLYKSFALALPLALGLSWWFFQHRRCRPILFLTRDAWKIIVIVAVAL